jgi:hypothetical protein
MAGAKIQMTKWAYVFIYDNNVGTREELKAFLDARPEILNWMYCMPNSFFLVSNKGASTLQDIFSTINKNNGRFLILDAETDKNGWLEEMYWKFLNSPKGVDDG